ncbi:MAG: hypothetical protein ACYSWQ_08840, partial [Planctomycetota bacterium]
FHSTSTPHNLPEEPSEVFCARRIHDLHSPRLQAGCGLFGADWGSNVAIKAKTAGAYTESISTGPEFINVA